MKSPQIIQQLKKHQSLRRNQFLSHCQVARHTEKKSFRAVRHHCSEVDGQVLVEKAADALDSQSAAFSTSTSAPDTAKPVVNPVVDATNSSASDTKFALGEGMSSKSDAAEL